MIWLAKEHLEKGTYPTDGEAVSMLTFLSVFAMGCTELKLEHVSQKFHRRVTLYTVGLCKMGYGMKGSMWYIKKNHT